jgi:poly-gamma-glutamate synthesis protein (capsule biosynthesis protein)
MLGPLLPLLIGAAPVTVAAGGDVLLGRGVDRYIEANGPAAVIEGMANALANADLAIVNLEGPLSRCASPTPKRYPLRAEPSRVQLLRAAHVDVVSLANNHALDCGEEGVIESVQTLRAAGIAVAGVEEGGPQRLVMLERRGRRIGVLAFSAVDDGAWTLRGVRYAMLGRSSLAEIRAARSAVDVLVVSVHWGREDSAEVLDGQRAWAMQIADAGADVIVGHHAHVSQPVEKMRDTLVLYGLGNLLFDRSGRAGDVARVHVGTHPERWELVPIYIENGRTRSKRP